MFCPLGGVISKSTSSQCFAEGLNNVSLEQSQNTSLKSENKKMLAFYWIKGGTILKLTSNL